MFKFDIVDSPEFHSMSLHNFKFILYTIFFCCRIEMMQGQMWHARSSKHDLRMYGMRPQCPCASRTLLLRIPRYIYVKN